MSNDFGFYGDEAEEDKVDDIKGVTDKVTDFVYTNLSYPCIIIKEGFQCPKHKMTVLSRMVQVGTRDDKDISLYFKNKGELFKMGMLSGVQIKAFLDIVGESSVEGFFDELTKLVGDKLLVLCA